MSLEREYKDLHSRYQTAIHKADKLEELVAVLQKQLEEKEKEIERLRKVENVELWERETSRLFKEKSVKEVALSRKVEELTEKLEAQKLTHQKIQMDIQGQVRKSEMKAEMGLKMTEDEYYTHIDNLKKDILRQKIQTAKREKETRRCLEVFKGIARGLRLDLRICMEKIDHECKKFLEDEEDSSLESLQLMSSLMDILDNIQYSCSKETLHQVVDDLPAHYSSFEAGLRIASEDHLCRDNTRSLPSSPVSSPKHIRFKGNLVELKKFSRSSTTPEGKQLQSTTLPLVGEDKGRSHPRLIDRKQKNLNTHSSSLPGSPLHEHRSLSRKIPLPNSNTPRLNQALTLSPRPPRKDHLPAVEMNIKSNRLRQLHPLKLGVVTPSLNGSAKEQSSNDRGTLESSSCITFSRSADQPPL